MDQQYTRRLKKIEAVLEQWLPDNIDAVWAEKVFPGLRKKPADNLLQSLAMPGRDLLLRGGKRWRPLLMTLVCESLGGGDAALPLAPLAEFCHNASLIHDDIEDSSDERRGKPAVHLLYGEDTAINSGAFLYFLPLGCIETWAAEMEKTGLAPNAALSCKNRIYATWGEYMRKLHLGQAMDIYWHRNFQAIPNLDEYYLMCALKTGCLARFAAVLGVLASEGSAAAAGKKIADNAPETYGEAAEKLGVGFQILDDVKNLTGGIPGKKRGDDIVEGKKSLPVLLYLNRYPEQRQTVSRCFSAARTGGVGADEVEELIGKLAAAGVLDEAKEQGLALIAKANSVFAAPQFADQFAGFGALIS